MVSLHVALSKVWDQVVWKMVWFAKGVSLKLGLK